MTKAALAFALGLLFALGLGISGMLSPHNVRAFLDVGGAWNPSLALVMAGAIGVFAPFAFLVRRRQRPLLDSKLHLPIEQRIDAKLIGGAALFGLGWGLSGYCPGPALISLCSGQAGALWFGGAMLLSAWAVRLVFEPRPDRQTEPARVSRADDPGPRGAARQHS